MADISFKNLFFRYYDRKICDGSITFSQLGISKTDFIRLCTEENFVFDQETLARICNVMKLSDEERIEFFNAATKSRLVEIED
ncbi:MAG: hypothetical protein PUE18_06145 [Firmicutes bacterium]|nr:hypothetical protein [Bacillota bacterium]